ncbi:MAG: hypothetical protein KY462_03500 [Actinobacteria bacterium]|nr:hypothetical protein [Actinomycetota bacterium]
MARVYCPECDVEVAVGDDGRDFLGHAVTQPAGPADTPPEAPQPWVFSVGSVESTQPVAADEATQQPDRPQRPDAEPDGDGLDLQSVGEEDLDLQSAGEEDLDLQSAGEEDLDMGSLEAAVAELGFSMHEADEAVDAVLGFEDVVERRAVDPGPSVARANDPQTPPAALDISEFGLDLTEAPEATTPPREVEAPDQDRWAVGDVSSASTHATAAEVDARDETDASTAANAEDDEATDLDPSHFVARPSGQRRGLFGRR